MTWDGVATVATVAPSNLSVFIRFPDRNPALRVIAGRLAEFDCNSYPEQIWNQPAKRSRELFYRTRKWSLLWGENIEHLVHERSHEFSRRALPRTPFCDELDRLKQA